MASRLSQLLSQSATVVLTKAQQIADRRHETLQSAHIAVALFGVDRTVAYDLLHQFCKQTVTIRGSVLPKETKEFPFIIEESARVARSYGFSHVEPEHLLFVILKHRKLKGFEVFTRHGLQTAAIIEKLTEWLYGVSILASVANQPQPSGSRPTAQTTERSPVSVIESTTTDLTQKARRSSLDTVVRREAEIEDIIRTLLRRKKNNPILIGDPGVGKTAIIHGLVQRIASFNVPAPLINITVLELSIQALIAGTMYRGQFEERFRNLLAELESRGKTILFIDEIHTITGTGSTEGSLDLANLLKPLLASGEITVIGATTHDEYIRYFASDRALERRFQPIIITEPDTEAAVPMVKAAAKHIARHHHVTIPTPAVRQAIMLSQRYLPDRFLPDKALDVLDEASSTLQQRDGSSSTVGSISKKLSAVLEQKYTLVESGKLDQAVRLRHKEQQLQSALTAARNSRGTPASTLTTNDLTETISRMTHIPHAYISTETTIQPDAIARSLTRHLVGQRPAIKTVVEALTRAQLGLRAEHQPLASFVFVGPTGVGKTETARLVAREVFGTSKALIKVDMSEFAERHSISQLIGSPKGYVGYDDAGTLVDRIRRQPFSVVLFDEIEKAHPDIFNLLLQVLEDGTLTDTHQRIARFEHSIIILTSNLGTELLNDKGMGFISTVPSADATIDREVTDFFRPELLGRLTDIIQFKPFSKAEQIALIKRRLRITTDRLRKRSITLSIDPAIIEALRVYYDPSKGARSVDDAVTQHVENTIVNHIAAGGNNSIELYLTPKKRISARALTR